MMKTTSFTIIFVYLSKGFNESDLFNHFEDFIDNEQPTTIIGDVNWNYLENTNMKEFMKNKGFCQVIKKPTFDKGTLIDHIYVNQVLMAKNVHTEQVSTYYTDHDIITLLIPKE